MKKRLIIILGLILFITSIFAEVSYKQNKKNDKFLNQLDSNLVQTIKIITAFNNMANNIPSTVKGLGRYRRFLMDITIETGRLRDEVKKALKADPETKKYLIQQMIISIKSDAKFTKGEITAEQDNYNYHFLDDRIDVYKKNKKRIRKVMMREEEKIVKKGKFTPAYFKLHTDDYMLSLLLDFIKIHTYLSKENRQTLVDVAKSVESVLNKG